MSTLERDKLIGWTYSIGMELTLLETFLVHRLAALLTEGQLVLGGVVHLFVTNWTVVALFRKTLVLLGAGCGLFACGLCICCLDTFMCYCSGSRGCAGEDILQF